MKTYPIIQGSIQVGAVTIEKCGLYLGVACHLTEISSGYFRLILHTTTQKIDLGICVSYDEFFGLKTKIAENRLHGQIVSFTLQSERSVLTEIPVDSDQPFSQIENLTTGIYVFRDHKGVIQWS